MYRGAQLGNTDHWLLITNIKIKLKVDHSAKPKNWLDMSHLQDPQILATYSCNIVNRLNVISEENAGDWKHFKDVITGATKEVIRDQHKTARQPWISNVTIQIINQHHEAQLQGNFEKYR